jgi:hypothetical protein
MCQLSYFNVRGEAKYVSSILHISNTKSILLDSIQSDLPFIVGFSCKRLYYYRPRESKAVNWVKAIQLDKVVVFTGDESDLANIALAEISSKRFW